MPHPAEPAADTSLRRYFARLSIAEFRELADDLFVPGKMKSLNLLARDRYEARIGARRSRTR